LSIRDLVGYLDVADNIRSSTGPCTLF